MNWCDQVDMWVASGRKEKLVTVSINLCYWNRSLWC